MGVSRQEWHMIFRRRTSSLSIRIISQTRKKINMTGPSHEVGRSRGKRRTVVRGMSERCRHRFNDRIHKCEMSCSVFRRVIINPQCGEFYCWSLKVVATQRGVVGGGSSGEFGHNNIIQMGMMEPRLQIVKSVESNNDSTTLPRIGADRVCVLCGQEWWVGAWLSLKRIRPVLHHLSSVKAGSFTLRPRDLPHSSILQPRRLSFG